MSVPGALKSPGPDNRPHCPCWRLCYLLSLSPMLGSAPECMRACRCCAARMVAFAVGCTTGSTATLNGTATVQTPEASGILRPDRVLLAVQSGQLRQAAMFGGFPCGVWWVVLCSGFTTSFSAGMAMTCLQKWRWSWACAQKHPAIHLWLSGWWFGGNCLLRSNGTPFATQLRWMSRTLLWCTPCNVWTVAVLAPVLNVDMCRLKITNSEQVPMHKQQNCRKKASTVELLPACYTLLGLYSHHAMPARAAATLST